MSRPELIKSDELEAELFGVPLWNMEDIKIVREIVCSNFAAAVGVVNSVAVLAESMNHHPDLLIYGWNKVRIALTTHDSGGLTELDFKLAKKIDELNF